MQVKTSLEEINYFLEQFHTCQPLYTLTAEPVPDPFIYHEPLNDFIEFVHVKGWIQPRYAMMGTAWSAAANKEAFIRNQGIENLQLLVAWFVRSDRFCSGFLAGAFADGYIQEILSRMLDLIAEQK